MQYTTIKRNNTKEEKTHDPMLTFPHTGATTLTTTNQGACETEEEISNRTETNTHLGRPKNDFIRKNKIMYSLAMNEVSILAADVKRRKEGVLRTHALNKIVDNVKKKRNLPGDLEIKIDTVKNRITNNKLKVDPHGYMGGTDPMPADIKPSIVQMILLMTKLRQPLSSGELVQFVDSCIGTQYGHSHLPHILSSF